MECKDIEKKSIAIISDIHGNYQALKSVIEDIRSKNIEIIICLGDIIGKGINSRKCIEQIRQNCQVVLKGNVDDRFCMNPDEFKDDENEYNRITYYQKTLNKEDIDYLVNLPLSEEFYISGSLVRLFHAFPDNPYKTINNYELDFRKKYEMFKPVSNTSNNIADVVIYGHVHYHFMEKIYGKTLINCGSVGSSGCPILENGYNSIDEISNAHYLIITGNLNDKENGKIEFSFESVPYDKETEIEDSNKAKNIEPDYDILLKTGYYPVLPKVMNKIKNDGYKLFESEE
ncbi:MAG: metallophosphoesterase family protein [Clostridia bacterium]|nr:metallophosphoesterase family protein [Clostridia bacterium]